MSIDISIDGNQFYLNGKPTYAEIFDGARRIEGLLFNSRMVQAIFDDANLETSRHWAYPDTGRWDPERNVSEFCAALPAYRRYGLLAVTVGLQGGGSVYVPEIYDNYINSAYRPDGAFIPAYFERLLRVIRAADACGMVVIVNYFYVKQARRLQGEAVARQITERVTDWLLRTGYRNLLVDVANESADWWRVEHFQPQQIHKLIEIVQQTTIHGRRLLAGSSTGGGEDLPFGRWQEVEDFHMPHGNGLKPEDLRRKLQRFKTSDAYRDKPKPILINEDSVFVENLEAAVDEYASWGFYHQGYGSHYKDLMDWTTHPREVTCADLSGFQTLPVNWEINDPWKKAFFRRVKALTSS